MKNNLVSLILIIVIFVAGIVLYWQQKNTAKQNAQPIITLTSPNGGEIMIKGSTYTITWTSKNIPEANKISINIRRVPPPPLSTEGQEFDPLIAINLENTGSYAWTVSDNYPEGNYILGLTSYASLPITNPIGDESDATFQIVNQKVIYKNNEYGFELTLPDSWLGYSILEETWNGQTVDEKSIKYQGPKVIIRNPNWIEAKIWQDIPIMVFTPDQWKLIEAESLAVSAAPIGPSKLGENTKYIFALPPRWVGFTDALGQDEAVKITETFKAF